MKDLTRLVVAVLGGVLLSPAQTLKIVVLSGPGVPPVAIQ